ncbi:mechanosensitive ion channel family protein [Mixta gaviniae]|uniref:Mechanosensitive ion channel protein MscS n=1 Tax=Mixta gaviniae TaxID=665914 RepID=A0A1X1E2F5_9GAMM|nr:mechanosensitive ion channel family protein [Mixta gaviniae]AUX93219.1 mechanosensitive ion channel protein MscS [Mixta gaviniae]ORM83059.1 mechanosensitive ion channel protein MscS [Mixta gaviniae]
MEDILSDQTLSLLTNKTFWINTAIVVGGTLFIYWVLRSLIGFISTRLGRFSEHHSSHFYNIAVEMLRTTSRLLLFIFSLLIAIKFIDLPATWRSAVDHGWFIALIFQFALWLDCGVRLWLRNMLRDPTHVRNPVTMVILGIMLRVFIWAIILLAILSNMGVNITALVASLGVGGIAVALAIQTVLSDVFASLAIGIDKPFEIGDFIVFGDVAGSIEHIGLKTTRIRSLSGEQIVCSNAILLQQTIHNYKRMQERRIQFRFGISYNTPAEKARQIGGIVKEIIQGVAQTRFDRAHFLSFDVSQLTYEVIYYVTDADYNKYMDIQQEINLQLMERLAALDVHFAFPIRHVQFTGGTLPEVNVADSASNEEGENTQQTAKRQMVR